jgi:hypothetical protein
MLEPAALPLPVRILGCGNCVPKRCVPHAELEHESGLIVGAAKAPQQAGAR